MTPNDLFLGFHVAKTGGTTLLRNIRDTIPAQEVHNFGPFSNVNRLFAEERLLHELDDVALKRLRFIFGHGVADDLLALFPRRTVSLFCAIRDPFSHLISRYKHTRRHKWGGKSVQDFATFANKSKPNFIARPLFSNFRRLSGGIEEFSLEGVLNVLRHFRFVFSTDGLDSQATILYAKLGAKLTPERRRVSSEEIDLCGITREQVEERNPIDTRLHKIVEEYAVGVTIDPDADSFSAFGYDPNRTGALLERLQTSHCASAQAFTIDQLTDALFSQSRLEAARLLLQYVPRDEHIKQAVAKAWQERPNPKNPALSLCFKAAVELNRGDPETALALVRQARQMDQTNPAILLVQARAHMKLGEHRNALQLADQVIESNGSNKAALNIRQKAVRSLSENA